MTKLYYFDLYGRAEVSRQALTICGVEFEDVRVTGDSWKELKASDKCEFGSVPVLELDDGTCLAQSISILRYINWSEWGQKGL
jgi:glutathione S-transferase